MFKFSILVNDISSDLSWAMISEPVFISSIWKRELFRGMQEDLEKYSAFPSTAT